jgi:hypothetical protein
MGTLNLLKQWSTDIPRRSLVGGQVYPELEIALFVPRGRYFFDKKAIEAYRMKNKIPGNVYQIPYGFRDMNGVKKAAEDEESDESAADGDFVEYWSHVFSANLGEEYRAPYHSETGLDLLRQIIGTYITLVEFSDLPIRSVLKYCELQMKS